MKFLACLVSVSILLLSSCQSDPPEIVSIDWKLELVQTTDEPSFEQYLQLKLEIIEPQGFDDLVTLEVFGPRDAWWSADVERAEYRKTDGTYTVLPGRLAVMAGEGGFAAGTYRVVIEDIPGNRHEREFFIPRHTSAYAAEVELPSVADHVLISAQGTAYLITYDAQGRVLDTRELALPGEDEGVPLRPLLEMRNVSYYRIVTMHPELPVISTSVPIPR